MSMSLAEYKEMAKGARGAYVRPEFIDIVGGDLAAAYILADIQYWCMEDENGNSRAKVERNGKHWFAQTREEWASRLRLNTKKFDIRIAQLEKLELIEKGNFKYDNRPIMHVRLLWDKFLAAFAKVCTVKPADLVAPEAPAADVPVAPPQDSDVPAVEPVKNRKNEAQTVGTTGFPQNGKVDFPKTGKSSISKKIYKQELVKKIKTDDEYINYTHVREDPPGQEETYSQKQTRQVIREMFTQDERFVIPQEEINKTVALVRPTDEISQDAIRLALDAYCEKIRRQETVYLFANWILTTIRDMQRKLDNGIIRVYGRGTVSVPIVAGNLALSPAPAVSSEPFTFYNWLEAPGDEPVNAISVPAWLTEPEYVPAPTPAPRVARSVSSYDSWVASLTDEQYRCVFGYGRDEWPEDDSDLPF